MHLRTWSATTLALLTTFGVAMAALVPSARPARTGDLQAFGGEWLYVEDLTEGRDIEEQGPPMSVTFGFRVDEDAVVMLRGKGANRREEPIALDGTAREVEKSGATSIYRGEWKDGVLEYVIESVSEPDKKLNYRIHREFEVTQDGLLVRMFDGEPAALRSLALYRHPDDIELPEPAQATIADVDWVTGDWVGTRGSSSIEERWGPPLGGALLGVSRTVKNGKMVAFEYLRIVERGGGLVYIAQPGGAAPTEFVLTDLNGGFAVFENPRHDSPQRIIYELLDEDSMSASIGFIHGGRGTRFDYTREGD